MEWLINSVNKHCILFFYNSSTSWATVSTREGEAFARALGVSFAECSSLNNDGVQAALEKATELAVEKNVTSKAVPFFRRRSKFQEVPVPPDLPPAGTETEEMYLFYCPCSIL